MQTCIENPILKEIQFQSFSGDDERDDAARNVIWMCCDAIVYLRIEIPMEKRNYANYWKWHQHNNSLCTEFDLLLSLLLLEYNIFNENWKINWIKFECH